MSQFKVNNWQEWNEAIWQINDDPSNQIIQLAAAPTLLISS